MNELSIGLIRGWWLETTQALVDMVSSEEALDNLRPFFQHSGRAGRRMYHEITGVLHLSAKKSAMALGYVLAATVGGEFLPTYLADDDSSLTEMKGCRTGGASWSYCPSNGCQRRE